MRFLAVCVFFGLQGQAASSSCGADWCDQTSSTCAVSDTFKIGGAWNEGQLTLSTDGSTITGAWGLGSTATFTGTLNAVGSTGSESGTIILPDNYRKDDSAGGWGGFCTCPNGNIYEVGDNNDSCGSIACEGGSSSSCSDQISSLSSGMKVTCGAETTATFSIDLPKMRMSLSTTLGKTNNWYKGTDNLKHNNDHFSWSASSEGGTIGHRLF